MSKYQHVLVMPFPAQGHATPIMKLAQLLVTQGVKVTFVNVDFFEARVLGAISETDKEQFPMRLVSISDGLEPDDDRKDGSKLFESMKKVTPGQLRDLINCSNDDEPITCAIIDGTIGWLLDVAESMGLKKVAFWSAGLASLALINHIPKLIEAGVLNTHGVSPNDELIKLSDEIPAWDCNEFTWSFPGMATQQKVFFDMCRPIKAYVEIATKVLCNTCYELDPSACAMIPNALSIGPLLATNSSISSNEDSTCLSWLDEQPAMSVIYVAFGSTTIFEESQFNELALGLELSGHSFLWVVRPDSMNGSTGLYPDGFIERTAGRVKIIKWAPQEKVLAHPSISCFFSHCGWNSTLEGLSSGVPFLCWPYFFDQFHNQKYICDIWKVGLRLSRDENGIVSRYEIKKKIDDLVCDNVIKANAVKLKEISMRNVSEGGSSFENFKGFIEWLKS